MIHLIIGLLGFIVGALLLAVGWWRSVREGRQP